MKSKQKYIWMIVTADEYELPILLCDSCKELSDKTGKSEVSIRCELAQHRSGRCRGYKFVKVAI